MLGYDVLENLRTSSFGATSYSYAYNGNNRISQITKSGSSRWTYNTDVRGNVGNTVGCRARRIHFQRCIGFLNGEVMNLVNIPLFLILAAPPSQAEASRAGNSISGSQICPTELRSQERAVAPPGYEVSAAGVADRGYSLGKVTFFLGHPKDNVRLAPESSQTKSGNRITAYIFGDRKNPVWVECRYRDSSDRFILVKRLESVSSCKVTQDISSNKVTETRCES